MRSQLATVVPFSSIAFMCPSAEREVMFIVGLYKTGTSLATTLCEAGGFCDPSQLTNAAERGYGQTSPRYPTRECKVVRSINDGIVNHSISDAVKEAETYLAAWDKPIVLKDPRFVFTLDSWLHAAQRLGRSCRVIWTWRLRTELAAAWGSAPFTSTLLDSEQLPLYQAAEVRMLAHIRCKVPTMSISLGSLKKIAQTVS